jgi:aconitate hydratase
MFSSYGARRGNHEVMVRGGFSNIRLKNVLAKGKEGGWTPHYPSGELMTIYDASMRYQSEKVPLIILAGKQYGAGSSRDWAAKTTLMLGVRAVIAESYERIHRSNLIAMGVMPLEFSKGENASNLGLDGTEQYTIPGIASMTGTRRTLTVHATSPTKKVSFKVVARLDNEMEIQYYRSGGILPYVFNKQSA